MGDEVKAVDRLGNKITIPESAVAELVKMGGRVATPEELTEHKLQSSYDSASTASKVAGKVLGVGARDPQTEAWHNAGVGAVTSGVHQAVVRKALDAIDPKMGEQYAQQLTDQETAYPATTTAGTVAGVVGGAAIGMGGAGAGAGAAATRLLPMNMVAEGANIAARGARLIPGVAGAMEGVAARGALGRAAATGASLAARGALEGAALSGIEQTTHDIAHDEPITGEKLYAAVGHGAFGGAVLGGGLGVAGSLGASAVRAVGRKASNSITARLTEGEVPALSRGRASESVFSEQPSTIADVGPRGHVDRSYGAAAEGPAASTAPRKRVLGLGIDPDAGLHAPEGKATDAFTTRLGPDDLDATIARINRSSKHQGLVPIPEVRAEYVRDGWSRKDFDKMLLKRDAARSLELKNADDPSRLANPSDVIKGRGQNLYYVLAPEAAEGGRAVRLAEDGFGAKVGRTEKGIVPRIVDAADEALPGGRVAASSADQGLSAGKSIRGATADGAARAFTDIEPGLVRGGSERLALGRGHVPGDAMATTGARALTESVRGPSTLGTKAEAYARELAQDQAWRAVGGGFGLQSTRYAQQANKYFANGTRDLGEVAIRHGIIEVSPTASPFEAAWQAGKNGTPAAMLPRIEAAEGTVGQRIGEITDASGARVAMKDVSGAYTSVRTEYAKKAGFEHVVGAIDDHEASLLSKLRPDTQGNVSVQSLLEQRKYLDELVYQETKTLDPKGRVASLRQVRTEIESLITRSLDDASGQVPGKLSREYKSLKKDFHALRILKEAAEDSAARSAKAATFGLGEKMAIGSALASGHLGAAPILAAGGKLLRERGNAVAAALLSQAAERGTIAKAVNLIDERVTAAAKGILRDASADGSPRLKSASSGKDRPPQSHEEAKAQRKDTIDKGQAIVKWAADAQTNPKRMLDAIMKSAELVTRGSGPKAAESYTTSAIRAFNFIVAGIPVKERRDPLDPRSTPPLTYEEADRLVRRHGYAVQPLTVWDDFERGRVTPEGLGAAKELMGESFVEFQMKLTDHLADHMLRNQRLTATRRLRIDKLLEMPAGPDLRPRSLTLLQANLMSAPEDEAPHDAQAGGNGPVTMQVQQSGFDSVEARKSG